MSFARLLEHKQNLFKLKLVSIHDFFYLDKVTHEVYFYLEDQVYIFLAKGEHIQLSKIEDFKKRFQNQKTGEDIQLYTEESGKAYIDQYLHQRFKRSLSSLSIGDIQRNLLIATVLMERDLARLYENPENNSHLTMHFQLLKNYFNFIYHHPHVIPELSRTLIKLPLPFLTKQPILSSIFSLGILKSFYIFSEKDLELLFAASYFKDIGMGLLPSHLLTAKFLTPEQKDLLSNHGKHSKMILAQRLSLFPVNLLDFIEHHHRISWRHKRPLGEHFLHSQNLSKGLTHDNEASPLISGIETSIIALCDMIAAIISPRPYRDELKAFDALKYTKYFISEDYPQEYRQVVFFFQNLFQKDS